MQSHTNFSAVIITLALTSVIASGAGLAVAESYGGARSEADERAVWNLWRTHLSSSNNHEAVIASFQQTLQNAPSNSLFTVARGLCSWHLLQLSKTNEAFQMLEDMTSAKPDTPLNTAGAEMGRRWLTRIDRENVRNALGCYYRQQIAYPENLESLKKTPRIRSDALLALTRSDASERARNGSERVPAPPLTDRWNIRWIYRLTGFQTIKGLDNQHYLLQSDQLKDTSDLKIALARPYADAIKLKPISAATTASGVQNVRFETNETKGQKAGIILMSEGTKLENITLVYVGNKIIILSDGDYWMIMPKP